MLRPAVFLDDGLVSIIGANPSILNLGAAAGGGRGGGGGEGGEGGGGGGGRGPERPTPTLCPMYLYREYFKANVYTS